MVDGMGLLAGAPQVESHRVVLDFRRVDHRDKPLGDDMEKDEQRSLAVLHLAQNLGYKRYVDLFLGKSSFHPVFKVCLPESPIFSRPEFRRECKEGTTPPDEVLPSLGCQLIGCQWISFHKL